MVFAELVLPARTAAEEVHKVGVGYAMSTRGDDETSCSEHDNRFAE